MTGLEQLEPQAVLGFFEALCAIPHGSGHTGAAAAWCVDFARARNLAHWRDGHDNVCIVKEASPGYENAPTVILQGHLDMVCEKDPGCEKNMEREGLDLWLDGEYLRARGTTLGGDDGIAVAMMLAILDDDALPHPRLEALFTSDEEVGMLGAAALDASPLLGRTMINLDSEEEGVFTVGCAGGSRARCILPLVREPFPGQAAVLKINGLQGGHSGAEIHRGRANADQLLGRALRALEAAGDLRLAWAAGGQKDNAIPVEASARLVLSDWPAAEKAVRALEAQLRREYEVTDPDLSLRLEALPALPPGEVPMDRESSRRAVCMLHCLPNGVQAMSPHFPGLVQTSLNLGVLTTGAGELSACFSVRSALGSQKELLKSRLACLMEQLGGRTEFSGEYPAWEYREHSPLRERMVRVFQAQYGRPPRVETIHAGLECGLLADKLPGLDCVSIGPELLDIHTPRERMSIPSVQRVWAFLLEVLAQSR